MTYLQNFIDFNPLKGKPNVKVRVLDIIILGFSEFKSILEIKGLKHHESQFVNIQKNKILGRNRIKISNYRIIKTTS